MIINDVTMYSNIFVGKRRVSDFCVFFSSFCSPQQKEKKQIAKAPIVFARLRRKAQSVAAIRPIHWLQEKGFSFPHCCVNEFVDESLMFLLALEVRGAQAAPPAPPRGGWGETPNSQLV